jgi:hypothetical protein
VENVLAGRWGGRNVQKCRSLASEAGVNSSALRSGICEIHSGGSGQCTALLALDGVNSRDGRWADVGGVSTVSSTEDVNLAVITVSARNVGESHVMGESVDNAALLRRKSRGEDKRFPGVVITEQEELGVELKRLGVVQVYVCISG